MKWVLKIAVLIFMMNPKFISAQRSYSISDIETKLSQTPKHVVIELHTNWCGVCAIQSKKINKNEKLIFLLENEFYYVRFDAESKETFVFNNHKFQNQDNKIHDFAKTISADPNSFPAWIIMNPDLEIIFQYNGLLESDELTRILEQIL